MYLLDTDIVIWILRGNQNVAEFVASSVKQELIGVSAMTVAEVYQHIFPKEITNCEQLFTTYEIYPIDERIARNGGLYWQEYHKKYLGISIADCLIAATVKEYSLILMTLNTKHFPMNDIRIFRSKKL